MNRLTNVLFGIGILTLSAVDAEAQRPANAEIAAPRPQAVVRVPSPALSFEPNRGQASPSVLYSAQGPGYLLALEHAQARIQLSGDGNAPSSVAIRFLDANPAAPLTGEDQLLGRHNYLSGTEPASLRTNIPTYGRVAYSGIYRGVDLSFYGNPDHLEYDFNLAPGSDPAQIRLALDGAKRVTTDRSGNLVLDLDGKTLRFLKPVAYQTERDGSRKTVEAAYRMVSRGAGKHEGQTLTFAVGSYDRTLPLVIDPVVDYAFYLPAPSSGNLYAGASTTDANGNTYIGGTLVNQAGYFVAKYNSSGQQIFQSYFSNKTFPTFGGSVNAIAVDPAGKIYLAGEVSGAYGGTLGPTPNGYQTSASSSYDNGFLSVVSADGSTITYATYFGGSGAGRIFALAIDSMGGAYVGGTATGTLPLTPGAPFTTPFGLNGTANPGFVAKFNTTLTGTSSLIYSTYLGATQAQVGFPGSQVDAVNAIAVDSSGNAYVTGNANAGVAYPSTPGAFRYDGRSPVNDVYVTKINSTGTAFAYSALLGPGSGYAIALDGSNDAYIAGAVYEDDYPTTSGAYQTAYSSGFVTELNPSGSALIYSTFLGGPADPFTSGAQLIPGHIALTPGCASVCEAYVAGTTTVTDFPLIDQVQPYIAGSTNSAFFVELAGNGSSALQSSYYASGAGFTPYVFTPGYGIDSAINPGIGVDSAANIYLVGDVLTANLPVTQSTAISGEAFLAKIGTQTGPTLVAAPATVNFGSQIVGVGTAKQGLAQPTVLLENQGTEAVSISSITVAPSNVFSATNNCNGSVAAGGNCTLTLNFTPGAVSTNPQNGTLTVASSSKINPTINLTGTAIDDRYIVATCGGVTPCPGLAFADTSIGSASPAQIVTLTNLGDTAVTLSSLASSSPDYPILTNCPIGGATLAHNATCEVSVQFAPTQAGNRPGTISAASNGTTADAIAIAATGTALLSPNASSLVLLQTIQNFGSEVIGGTSVTMSVTVFNNGSSPATVFIPAVSTSGDASGVNDFSIVSNTCTGVELLPETTCAIGLAFVPTATGTRSGTITIPNSTTTTLTSSLTGIGLAAQQTLEFSPASVTFPDQVDNIQSTGFTVSVYNTGASPVTFDRVVISGASFLLTATTCPDKTLAPSALPSEAQSCTVTVAFDPVATGAQTGSLTLIDTEGRQSAFSLAGNGIAQNPLLLLNPNALNFGSEPVGSTSATQSFSATNVGNVPITITGFSATGDFAAGSQYCGAPITLQPGSTCSPFTATFTPTKVASPDSGTLTMTSTAGNATLSLTGIGIQATKAVVLTPSTNSGLAFGNVEVGSEANSSGSAYGVNVYNAGSDSITFSGAPTITGANAADFTIFPVYGDCSRTVSTLTPGAVCGVFIRFVPSAAGNRTATLTIADDASAGNQTILLSGAGTTSSPPAGLNPYTVAFAPQVTATSSNSAAIAFYNSSASSITIASTAIQPSANFAYQHGCNNVTVAPGGNCSTYVVFSPSTTGSLAATMTLTDTEGNTYTVRLFGYGLQQVDSILVSPQGLAYGPQPQRSSSGTDQFSMLNQSSLNVAVGQATGSNVIVGSSTTGAFTVTSDGCSNQSLRANYPYPCVVSVTLSPTASTALGTQTGALTFPLTYADGTTGSYTVQVTGTVVADIDSVELSAPLLTFPDEAINATQSASTSDGYQSFTISNKSNLAIKIGQAALVNTFAYFAGRASSNSSFDYYSDNCSNQTIQPGYTCTVTIGFVPLTAGQNITGSMAFSITFVDGTTKTLTASYSGNALPATNSLLISPNSANFGEVVVGQSGVLFPFTVTNNGNQPVAFGTYSLTSTQSGTNFARSNFDYNSCSGTTLAVGGVCTFNISFTPQSAGAINGTLTIADGSATGGPHTIPLVGTGVSASAPVTASQQTVNFGNVPVGGASTPQVVYITNQSTSNITGASYTLAGDTTDFKLTPSCSATLANRTACGLQVVFSPATTSLGAQTATVTVAYSGGGPLVITLNGTGVPPAPAVALFPSSIVYNTQDIGSTSVSQFFAVKNTGSASLTIASIASTGSAQYAITSNACSGTLAAGADCLVGVAFSPTASGTHSGTITVTDNATGSPQTVSLTALVPKATLNVTSLSFAAQNVGTASAAQTAILSNAGTGPLYINTVAVGGTNASDFTQTNTCGTDLLAGATCNISVKFAPNAAGPLSATLVVTDNAGLAAGSTQSIALSGTGTPVAATPTFTPSAGTYTATQSVTLQSATAGAAIYYTTDGSTPSTSSNLYSAAISVSSSETIKAIAVASGYANSNVVSAAYVIEPASTASVSPTSIAFANTNVGSTSAYISATLTNNGSTALTGVALSVTGTDASSFFLPSNHQGCGTTLAAGASCTFYAAFRPTSGGALTASVQISDSAGNSPQAVALSGTGISASTATVSPTSIAFANTKVGSTSAYISATLTNNGGTTLTGIAFSITGADASSFFLPSNHQGCGATLAAGASCSFDAAFRPTTGGALTASVQITDSAGNSPQTVALSGTGISASTATVSPTSIAFATTTVGSTSAYIQVTLTNNGSSTLTGIAFTITGTDASSFLLPSNHQGCGATLAAGASCTFDAAFKPTVTGPLSASVQITDSATNSPQTVALSGTGR